MSAGVGPVTRPVQVSTAAGGVSLAGDLTVPAGAVGLVVFAHGSGSSRHSPRNRMVADRLHGVRLATLLMDLLTPDEDALDRRTAELRFDIVLLAGRLVGAVDWLAGERATTGASRGTDGAEGADGADGADRAGGVGAAARLPVGLFGASTGAAAALIAAADRPDRIGAVVSRGGRPDLAADRLGEVRAPTLLLVGGDDPEVLGMNRHAGRMLTGAPCRLSVVAGATHLFEEAGALEQVARMAGEWFGEHLPAREGGSVA